MSKTLSVDSNLFEYDKIAISVDSKVSTTKGVVTLAPYLKVSLKLNFSTQKEYSDFLNLDHTKVQVSDIVLPSKPSHLENCTYTEQGDSIVVDYCFY